MSTYVLYCLQVVVWFISSVHRHAKCCLVPLFQLPNAWRARVWATHTGGEGAGAGGLCLGCVVPACMVPACRGAVSAPPRQDFGTLENHDSMICAWHKSLVSPRCQRALYSQGYFDRAANDWQRELALATFDTMGEDDVKFYTDEEGFPYYG